MKRARCYVIAALLVWLSACGGALPPQAGSAALHRDLERLVELADTEGWSIDRVEIEEALPAALMSLCRTSIDNRASLLSWLDERIDAKGGDVREVYEQRSRDLGGMTFIDLRDRYGITQLVFNMEENSDLCLQARKLGREFVVQVTGKVIERSSKNAKMATGDVEVVMESLTILNASVTPPFTIEDETDGGEDLRMKYRYLDLRRFPLRRNMMLRHQLSIETRKFMDNAGFLEIETPYLIKSTPEGARDFVVPSRMNSGQFYALPQSPQTFKQLLMISGYDKYYQVVKCFRDEDLRADRQPEFTQIDCEMSFVDQEDILNQFESLIQHLFRVVKKTEIGNLPRMTYANAMAKYGSDKPDIRFGMEFQDLAPVAKEKGFNVFDQAECVLAIVATGCAEYSRKQLDALTDWVKRPQIGAKGLVYCKCNEDGSFKSSVDKFFDQSALQSWAEHCGAKPGDLILALSGDLSSTRKQLGELRLHMGSELGLRLPGDYKPLWVVDFPLLEWDEETRRFHAMHHPFTSPKKEDLEFHWLNPRLHQVRSEVHLQRIGRKAHSKTLLFQ